MHRWRRTSTTELLRLQGMTPQKWRCVVSKTQFGYQIGNAMSQNVLERLLVKLLPAAGLVKPSEVTDRWAMLASWWRPLPLQLQALPPA